MLCQNVAKPDILSVGKVIPTKAKAGAVYRAVILRARRGWKLIQKKDKDIAWYANIVKNIANIVSGIDPLNTQDSYPYI